MASDIILLYGGSFNPPTKEHEAIVRRMAALGIGTVVVAPCGPRPDKATVEDTPVLHRAAMCMKAFGGIPGVELDLSDLERKTFTRHADLIERYRSRGQVCSVVGSDLVQNGSVGKADIQTSWYKGRELWDTETFFVVPRETFPITESDLPPKGRIVGPVGSGSSSDARNRAQRHEPLTDLLSPRIVDHVDRYGLYRGETPRTTMLTLAAPIAFVVAHDRDPAVPELVAATGMRTTEDIAEANCILAVGGDGTLLRAVRRHWQAQLPFIGVNAGTKGYMMNAKAASLAGRPLTIRSHGLQFIEADVTLRSGEVRKSLAFNDAWLERMSLQTATFDIDIDGERKLSRVYADGLLLSTPQGSTAYARAMGASPLRADANSWLLVGSNVGNPLGWKSAPLSMGSEVHITALSPDKRPVRAVVDSHDLGDAAELRARLSSIASAEVCFHPSHDLAAKLAADVFPSAS